jgi:hypothetical protein
VVGDGISSPVHVVVFYSYSKKLKFQETVLVLIKHSCTNEEAEAIASNMV